MTDKEVRERYALLRQVAAVRLLADEMEDQARGSHDEDDDAYRDAANRIRTALDDGEDTPDVWDPTIPPGGWVCADCLMPTETVPCTEHQPHAHARSEA